jgi:hypothetical protein
VMVHNAEIILKNKKPAPVIQGRVNELALPPLFRNTKDDCGAQPTYKHTSSL